MKKKILFISSSSHFIKVFFTDLINKISKNYEVIIITNFKGQKLNFEKRIVQKNIEFRRKLSLVYDFKNYIKLKNQIKFIKPDLIITCTPKIIIYSILIKIFLNFKIIHFYTGIYWINYKRPFSYFFKNIDKINFSLIDQTYFDSKNQINFFKKKSILKNNFKLILNGSVKGVNLKKFNSKNINSQSLKESLGIDSEKKIILFLGRINVDKGIYTLLKAFELILSQKKNIFLVIVGVDEMNIKEILNENYKHLLQSIKIYPHTDNPEIFLNICNVLCIPSLREGFGNVVIEAGACKIPVVGSNIPGLDDSLIDNFNGLRFSVNNPNDLSKKLLKIIFNDEIHSKLSSQAHKFIKKNFNSELVLKFLTNEIDKLIHQNIEISSLFYKFNKRLFDLSISFMALIVLFPLMVFIFVLIIFIDRQFPIFKQRRSGLNFKKFNLYKFKTMKNNIFNHQKKITTLGKILRISKLDEIPQLLNIFLNDMSFIGPRPLYPEFDSYYKKFHINRMKIKPGLTGLAQIKLRKSNDWNRKFNFDYIYFCKKNLSLDLYIFYKTFFLVFHSLISNSKRPSESLDYKKDFFERYI